MTCAKERDCLYEYLCLTLLNTRRVTSESMIMESGDENPARHANSRSVKRTCESVIYGQQTVSVERSTVFLSAHDTPLQQYLNVILRVHRFALTFSLV